MLERKEERWAVDKDWETETNCSSFTSMPFVVPAQNEKPSTSRSNSSDGAELTAVLTSLGPQ